MSIGTITYTVRGLGINFSPPQRISTFQGRVRLTMTIEYAGLTFESFPGAGLFDPGLPINNDEPLNVSYRLIHMGINGTTQTVISGGAGGLRRDFVIGPRLASQRHTPTIALKSIPPALWRVKWSAIGTQKTQRRRGTPMSNSTFKDYLRTGKKHVEADY